MQVGLCLKLLFGTSYYNMYRASVAYGFTWVSGEGRCVSVCVSACVCVCVNCVLCVPSVIPL